MLGALTVKKQVLVVVGATDQASNCLAAKNMKKSVKRRCFNNEKG